MSAEERRKFEDLKRRRDNLRRAHKENDSDLYRFLAEQYSDPSHFIYELLQNAEDACASKVLFVLTEGGLDVSHNGDDFRFRNIEAITGIGDSTKKEELTKIGEFGIGFKSVFAITSTPYIYSGNYNIKIEDLYVPYELNKPPEDRKYDTLIKLPFNHGKFTKKKVTKGKAFEITNEELENLKPKTLLFLKNIKKIKWEIKKGTLYSEGSISRRSKYIGESRSINVKEVNLSATEKGEKYLVFDRPFKAKKGKTKKRSIEVAFKLDKGKLVREENSKLVVFFPTEKDTFLNFVIQGPYVTTPNRESIPEGNEENRRIVDKTGELVADCLHAIKNHNDLKHLYVDFLNLLPIELEKRGFGRIYLTLYDKVAEKLKSEKLLPTLDGGYAYPENSLISGEGVYEILNKADMGRLYPKQSWIDTRITREFRAYLRHVIKVEPVNFTSFMRKVCEYGTADFMRKKTDIWMIAFYTKLQAHNSLWKQYENDPFLRYEPIIRLNTGKHIAPFVLPSGIEKLQVYLPNKDMSDYNTVKGRLVNKSTKKFLKELGLTNPNIVARVTELILPKYEREIDAPDNQYFNDFRDILDAYEKMPESEKKRLKNSRFILAIENLTGKEILKAPNETYFRTADLEVFFEGYDQAYFVSKKLLRGDKGRKMLGKLGVENKPRRIEIKDGLTLEEKQYLRGYGRLADEELKNYEYDGLENFIKRGMNAPKSYLLWKLLLESIRNFSYSQDEFRRYQLPGRFFDGKYRKKPQSRWGDWKSFPSNFTKLLRNSDWLVDKTGKFRKPSDIRRSELAQGYVMAHHYSEELQALENELELNPDIPPPPDPIYQLQEDEQEKLKLLRKYPNMSISRIEEILSDASKSQNENQTPENETDENIPETPIRRMKKPILKIRPASVPSIHPTPGPKPKPNQPRKEANSTDKKESGWKVEKRVFETLKNEEEFEVVWLNEDEERGIGCDFHVKRGDEIIKYIEVKSKTEEDPKEVTMTGAQWHLAWEQGNKYFLYVVSNIRSDEDAEGDIYQNPVKLWKERKLLIGNLSIKLPKDTQDD